MKRAKLSLARCLSRKDRGRFALLSGTAAGNPVLHAGLAGVLMVAAALQAVPVGAAPVAITGGTVHTVSGPTIPNGTVVFDNGKIVAVGAEVAMPPGADVVDATGLHVYPGMIAAHTVLGLVEINSVKGTVDNAETGTINPNARARVALNPDSEIIPVTRANGVLTALSTTTGGVITGTSVLWNLDGWTWEDMTVREPVGIHVNWPNMNPGRSWWVTQSAEEQKKQAKKNLDAFFEALADARAYHAARKAAAAGGPAHEVDVRWEAMIPALEGTVPLFVQADEYDQIESVLEFAEREKDLRIVLVGGRDAPRLAARIAELKIPVIVDNVLNLPRRGWEPYDAVYAVAGELHAAGVPFCISMGSSGFSVANLRNLPYHAGMAAAYGLPPEEALKAVTLYPARILGVEDRLGSLDAGKDANLLITDGDLLEIRTHVLQAWIAGNAVDLASRHTRLYDRYRNRPRTDGGETRLSPEPAVGN